MGALALASCRLHVPVEADNRYQRTVRVGAAGGRPQFAVARSGGGFYLVVEKRQEVYAAAGGLGPGSVMRLDGGVSQEADTLASLATSPSATNPPTEINLAA